MFNTFKTFSLPCNRRYERIMQQLKTIEMKTDEAIKLLEDLKDQLTKANREIQDKIALLQDAIDNADVPKGVTDALDNLKVVAQSLDDIVPDAPAKPTE